MIIFFLLPKIKMFIFLKKIYIIFNLLYLYAYLFLTPIFSYFIQNSNSMKNYFFINYGLMMNNTSKKINLYSNINCVTPHKINKEMNLLILNHTSILDNYVLSKILSDSKFSWNDIRSISRISNRSIQNTVLEEHGMFLVSSDLKTDTEKFETVWKKWEKSNDTIQILLFPEGTIFNDTTKNKEITKSQKYILKKILKIDNFENLLIPKIGAYNLIINKLKDQIKNIYDFSISYTDNNNKRIYNEEVILDHLAKNDLKIDVKINRYDVNQVIKDPYWLFKIWKDKDQWLNEVENEVETK